MTTDRERFRRRKRLQQIFGSIDFSKLNIAPPPDDPDDDEPDDDEEATLSTTMQQAIAALILANPRLTAQQACYFLLHNPHGKTYLDKTKRDTPPMTRTEEMREMRDFAKSAGGMNSISKHIIAKGATSLTEHEFTSLLMESAKVNKLAGESDAAAFSRIFMADLNIRKAHAITKNTLAPPSPTEPVLVVDNVSKADQSTACTKLQTLATELRRQSPQLSEAQAFSKVFTDPANAALANAAHRRPEMTTSYAYPNS
jgi:hypothetical protein